MREVLLWFYIHNGTIHSMLLGKKLLVGGYIRAMNAPDFTAWVRRRDDQRRGHVPHADRIVPLVAGAGPTGMTRRQLGHAVPLAPAVLDQLLDALVRFGSLTAASDGDTVVYRTAQRSLTRQSPL